MQILSLSALLVVYREGEVAVASSREDNFYVDLEGGKSVAILRLIKDNIFMSCSIPKWNDLFQKYNIQYQGRRHGGS